MGSESRLPSCIEKAIRQCLHQLRNLQNICQPVLPEEVYLRAIGTLANSVLEELLIRITTLEDIPADAALQLVDQCQIISNTLPLLFKSKVRAVDLSSFLCVIMNDHSNVTKRVNWIHHSFWSFFKFRYQL